MFDFNISCRKKAEDYKTKISAAQERIMAQAALDITDDMKQSTKGNLKEYVNAEVIKSGNKITIKAGDIEGRAPYAIYLEYGTINMAARPWLMPAFAKHCAQLEKLFAKTGELI